MAEEIYATWDSLDFLLTDIANAQGGRAASRIQDSFRGKI